MNTVIFIKELGIKMKRIAGLLPISKSTIYRKTKVKKQEKQRLLSHSSKDTDFNTFIKERINQIALKYPFYDYRRVYVLLRRGCITVNHKKVYRIYKELSLQRPKKKKKIRKGLIKVYLY